MKYLHKEELHHDYKLTIFWVRRSICILYGVLIVDKAHFCKGFKVFLVIKQD